MFLPGFFQQDKKKKHRHLFFFFFISAGVFRAGLCSWWPPGSVSGGHSDGAGGLSGQGSGGLEQLPVSPVSHPTDRVLCPRRQPAAQLGPRTRWARCIEGVVSYLTFTLFYDHLIVKPENEMRSDPQSSSRSCDWPAVNWGDVWGQSSTSGQSELPLPLCGLWLFQWHTSDFII